MFTRRDQSQVRTISPGGFDLLADIQKLAANRPAIVLDDDPTGPQTLAGVTVLTAWTARQLTELLAQGDGSTTFLLTNSRALEREAAIRLARDAGRQLRRAELNARRHWSVISRSDSTLRGHFPAEVDALGDGLDRREARIVLAPFYGPGGRVTRDDTHFLSFNGRLVPVGQTEFARDRVFGYRSSNLRSWVAEKAGQDRFVTSVSLTRLRNHGPASVLDALADTPPRGVLIINAEEERDIELAVLGVVQAELNGMPIVVRSAASFVRARAGQPPQKPFTDLPVAGENGLVVVGSHVALTTTQLRHLIQSEHRADHIEVGINDVLDEQAKANTVSTLAARVDDSLRRGRLPVLATPRQVDDYGLETGSRVARALADIVSGISERPSWVVAKGGITSSQIATQALRVRSATVIGQLLPGVSVWRCGSESRWPGLVFVVFPGNVGDHQGLSEAVRRLRQAWHTAS